MGKIRTRITFGLIMAAALSALLWADWRLESHAQPISSNPQPTTANPQLATRNPQPATANLPSPPGLLFALLVMAVEILAVREVARLAQGAGVAILRITGVFGCLALATLPFWRSFLPPCLRVGGMLGLPGGDIVALLTLSLIVCLVFAEQMIRWRKEDAFRRIACTLLAVAYLGVGGALIFWIRMRHGVPVLVLFLTAVKFTDIGAYFTGTAIGKHKMIPWLSPGKSWEGLVGGLASAAGISVLITWWFNISQLTLPIAAVFGGTVGLAGQFGDLCESLLKRSANSKDSGSLVPEFGGIMDIIDSPLLAAPIAILFLALVA